MVIDIIIFEIITLCMFSYSIFVPSMLEFHNKNC